MLFGLDLWEEGGVQCIV